MSFPSSCKRFFNAKMQLKCAALKPHSATRSQFQRLSDLSQTKQFAVEHARRILLTSGHGQLHMIETKNFHRRMNGRGSSMRQCDGYLFMYLDLTHNTATYQASEQRAAVRLSAASPCRRSRSSPGVCIHTASCRCRTTAAISSAPFPVITSRTRPKRFSPSPRLHPVAGGSALPCGGVRSGPTAASRS